MQPHQNDDLRRYRTYGLTHLQLMMVLGLLGIAVEVILKLFF